MPVRALAALGLTLSLVLEFLHVRAYLAPTTSSFCAVGEHLDCTTVALSRYSVLLGVPVPLWGAAGFLAIVGAWQVNRMLALLAATGMVLGAAYMLWLYRRVIFGQLTKAELKGLLDLSPREAAVFAPLAVLTLWMGIYPSSFSAFYSASVANLIAQHQAAIQATRQVAGL